MKKPDDNVRLQHMLDAALDAIEFLGKTTFEELQSKEPHSSAVGFFTRFSITSVH